MGEVHRMLDDHMAGKVDQGPKIAVLLTLSLWHRLLLEGQGFRGAHEEYRAGSSVVKKAVRA